VSNPNKKRPDVMSVSLSEDAQKFIRNRAKAHNLSVSKMLELVILDARTRAKRSARRRQAA
jgi:hypothetical protein